MKAAAKKTYGKKGDADRQEELGRHRHRHLPVWSKIDVPESWANATTRAPSREAEVHRTSTSRPSWSPSWLRKATPCPSAPSILRGAGAHRHHQVREARHRRQRSRMACSDNCIQCNQCSLVCPHACIRPVLMHLRKIMKNAPDGFDTKPATGKEFTGIPVPDAGHPAGLHRLRQLRRRSAPPRRKALVMKPAGHSGARTRRTGSSP